MEKEAVKELLDAWEHARKACIYERSTDFDYDLARLAEHREEWEKRLGLKSE
jgi:hypothetical protein